MVDAAPHPVAAAAGSRCAPPPGGGRGVGGAGPGPVRRVGGYEDPAAPPLLLDDEERLAGWDADLERLLAEARAARSGDQAVPLPAQLSTTAVMRLQADPEAFAAELARPMPQPPSRAARFGTRFHLWVERYFGPGRPTGALGQQPLVDPDDLPDRADAGRARRAGAAGAVRGLRGRAVRPDGAVRAGGAVQRGAGRAAGPRPDRCGLRRRPRERVPASGWWTGRPAGPRRPTRCSWRSTGWPGPRPTSCRWSEVDAVFYYVRTDQLVRPPELPGPVLRSNRLLAGG